LEFRDTCDALLKPAAAPRARTESYPPQTLSLVPMEVHGVNTMARRQPGQRVLDYDQPNVHSLDRGAGRVSLGGERAGVSQLAVNGSPID